MYFTEFRFNTKVLITVLGAMVRIFTTLIMIHQSGSTIFYLSI